MTLTEKSDEPYREAHERLIAMRSLTGGIL